MSDQRDRDGKEIIQFVQNVVAHRQAWNKRHSLKPHYYDINAIAKKLLPLYNTFMKKQSIKNHDALVQLAMKVIGSYEVKSKVGKVKTRVGKVKTRNFRWLLGLWFQYRPSWPFWYRKDFEQNKNPEKKE